MLALATGSAKHMRGRAWRCVRVYVCGRYVLVGAAGRAGAEAGLRALVTRLRVLRGPTAQLEL